MSVFIIQTYIYTAEKKKFDRGVNITYTCRNVMYITFTQMDKRVVDMYEYWVELYTLGCKGYEECNGQSGNYSVMTWSWGGGGGLTMEQVAGIANGN